MYEKLILLKRYTFNVLIGVDQLVNALLGGDPDETLSSRMAKARKHGCKPCYYICRMLHWFDPNHCKNEREDDEGDREIWSWKD